MRSEYLWDTNTVIYFLQHQLTAAAEQVIDGIIEIHQPVISVITEIEMLSWRTATLNDVSIIKIFISGSQIHQLTDEVKTQTIEIRKAYKIKLPDAIIAATAIVYNSI